MPKMKDIPKIDRPREKFLKKGTDALSKSDLLSILLGSGIKISFLKIKNIIKFPIVLTVFAMLLFGISCFGMGMDAMASFTNCPFGGHSTSICKENPTEHIQELQSLFTTLPTKETSVLLSLLLVLFASLKLRQIFSVPEISQTGSHINLFYIYRPPIFNFLQEAFSNGILNPKLF